LAEAWKGFGDDFSFSAAVGEDAFHFAIGLAFDEVLASIPMGFTCAEADEDFKTPTF